MCKYAKWGTAPSGFGINNIRVHCGCGSYYIRFTKYIAGETSAQDYERYECGECGALVAEFRGREVTYAGEGVNLHLGINDARKKRKRRGE